MEWQRKRQKKSASKGMCALWCDTDFRGTDGQNGGKYTLQELVEKIDEIGSFESAWNRGSYTHGVSKNRLRTIKGVVTFTGGEPFLQLDKDLVRSLLENKIDVCVETNGTLDISAIKLSLEGLSKLSGKLWITVSPKPPAPIHDSVYSLGVNEVKLVYDRDHVNPIDYENIPSDAYYLQPLDSGDSAYNQVLQAEVIDYVMHRPRWRVSAQNHKIWGLD